MQDKTCLGYVPILLSEGGCAYAGYAPHIIGNASANAFSLRRFGIIFFAETSAAVFAETSGIHQIMEFLNPDVQISIKASNYVEHHQHIQ